MFVVLVVDFVGDWWGYVEFWVCFFCWFVVCGCFCWIFGEEWFGVVDDKYFVFMFVVEFF